MLTSNIAVDLESTVDAEIKLARAIQRGYFRSIDLFSGCGGLSLGFERAGFRCVAAVEQDNDARASHISNFSAIAPMEGYQSFEDIKNTPPSVAVAHLCDSRKSESEVLDLIIGGPPCQAYSRLGRAALWRNEGSETAHVSDERASLYEHFLEYVACLRPIAFVLENVPEMGRFANQNVAEIIAVEAERLGYTTRYTLLNSVWYGVPQLRDRLFIIGIASELNLVPDFPEITHKYDLPVGYNTSRSVTGRVVVLEPHDHYVAHGTFSNMLRPAVTASTALSDLPSITYHLTHKLGKNSAAKAKFELGHPYLYPGTNYSEQMRTWPKFHAPQTVEHHQIRHTPRDYETFRRMPPNAMYPDAVRIAQEIFEEKRLEYEKHSGRLEEESEAWKKLYNETVPPYTVAHYRNKFHKMAPNEPARTVPAHLGKDTYSHIHYDSDQARGISVREAARLQSIPDGFNLCGGINAKFTQIGNAVPPLMAYAVALRLQEQLYSYVVGQGRNYD